MRLTASVSFLAASIAACSSSSPTSSTGEDASVDSGTDSGTDSSIVEGGACALTLYSDSACQSWLDANCCGQERACSQNLDCKAIVDCVNQCPVPRADSCVLACSRDGGGVELNAVADCSRQAPLPPNGNGCGWP
jgi:hypothetical protein